MKKNFKSMKELTDYLNNCLINAMDGVGEKALKEMKKYVKKEFEKTQPEVYQRTYEFLNSIVRTKATLVYGVVVVSLEYNVLGHSNVIITDFDTQNKIYPQLVSETPLVGDQNWNWHADFWGDDVSSLIPLWLEYGTNNPYYSHDGINAIIHMEDWIKDNIRKQLAIELRKQGIQTK